MSRKHKTIKAPDPQDAGMTMEEIIAQVTSIWDRARPLLGGAEPGDVWQASIKACDAAIAILTALQTEGIHDPEQVRDLIADYNALAKQYQMLHQKYEVVARAERLGCKFICPDCHRQISHYGAPHCWFCGKRLDWG